MAGFRSDYIPVWFLLHSWRSEKTSFDHLMCCLVFPRTVMKKGLGETQTVAQAALTSHPQKRRKKKDQTVSILLVNGCLVLPDLVIKSSRRKVPIIIGLAWFAISTCKINGTEGICVIIFFMTYWNLLLCPFKENCEIRDNNCLNEQ